jgi:putative membrane protein
MKMTGSGNAIATKSRDRRVHMANERTFLAWIRTSIAIMAFGFVVEKFGLFVRQFTYYLSQTGGFPKTGFPADGFQRWGYSAVLGITLVGLGAVMGVLAFIRYKKVERQINEDTYQPLRILDVMLMLSVLIIGFFLALYLMHSV